MNYASRRFRPNPTASEEILSSLVASLAKTLPSNYLAFFERSNGGEGFVGKRYVQLWAADKVIEINQGYKVADFAPEFFLIGSDGGGEAYALRLSSEHSEVYEIPFIPLDAREAKLIAASFDSFVAGIKL